MFDQLLSKIAKTLQEGKIPYMVIGGQALLQYGQPRLTEDIDITLGVGVDKVKEVLESVKKIELFPFQEATPEFIHETNVLPCKDNSTGIRIDFIFSYLPYEKMAIARSKKIKVDQTEINFASAEDLIIHKMFAGRPRDLEDVKNILIKQKEKLDLSYIQKQLSEFSQLAGYENTLSDFEKLSSSLK